MVQIAPYDGMKFAESSIFKDSHSISFIQKVRKGMPQLERAKLKMRRGARSFKRENTNLCRISDGEYRKYSIVY